MKFEYNGGDVVVCRKDIVNQFSKNKSYFLKGITDSKLSSTQSNFYVMVEGDDSVMAFENDHFYEYFYTKDDLRMEKLNRLDFSS